MFSISEDKDSGRKGCHDSLKSEHNLTFDAIVFLVLTATLLCDKCVFLPQQLYFTFFMRCT